MKDTNVIGLAGCGAMGLPMAQQLQKAGYSVWGFDVQPADKFKDFASRMIEDPSKFLTAFYNNKLITVKASDNVIRILPPLNVKKEEIDESIDIINKTLKQ